MEENTKKYLKWGLIIVLILVVIAVVYFMLKPGDPWTAIKGGDIPWNADIQTDDTGLTLEAAKKKAIELGAKSFLQNGTRTIFKNATGPVTTDPKGDYILYVKK